MRVVTNGRFKLYYPDGEPLMKHETLAQHKWGQSPILQGLNLMTREFAFVHSVHRRYAIAEMEMSMKQTLTLEEKLQGCQDKIQYQFRDIRLLQAALTHASGANRRVESNERLEFLGDSILGMVICIHLYRHHPELLEGELTKIKSNVVSRRTCAKVARRLGLDAYLILGRGMLKSVLPRSLLSDVYEALIAAVFLDGGIDAATMFIESTMHEELLTADEDAGIGNYKSILQHHCQRDLGLTPRYLVLRQSGPDHDKVFAVAAELGDRQFSAASGKNKKDAEQRAACNALAELQGKQPPYDSHDCN